jgi:hypothetical protein
MAFKKNHDGLLALRWWRNACLNWCYNRVEEGKFGDQKYLDDWTTRFYGVHEIKHLGAGVAPWNVQQYLIERQNQGPLLKTASGDFVPVLFYHFHALRLFQRDFVDLCPYEISANARQFLYGPYLQRLLYWENYLLKEFSYQAPRPSSLRLVSRLKRTLKGNLNYFPTSELKEWQT